MWQFIETGIQYIIIQLTIKTFPMWTEIYFPGNIFVSGRPWHGLFPGICARAHAYNTYSVTSSAFHLSSSIRAVLVSPCTCSSSGCGIRATVIKYFVDYWYNIRLFFELSDFLIETSGNIMASESVDNQVCNLASIYMCIRFLRWKLWYTVTYFSPQ